VATGASWVEPLWLLALRATEETGVRIVVELGCCCGW
jgi:hypothetical protein